jgi:hypothetical protein
MSTDQQKKLLATLLAVMAVVVVWQYVLPLLDQKDQAAQIRAQREAAMSGEVVALKLADLDAPSREYSPSRNIFRYAPKQVAPPPPPSPPPPRAAPPPPAPPPQAPVRRPPKVDVSLIGIFGPEDRRIAVFRDGQKILNALEQEVLKEKFIVHEIGLESVDFTFVGFPDYEPQRVTMAKN